MSVDLTPRVDLIPPSEWDERTLDALGAFPAGLKFVLAAWEARPQSDQRGTHLLEALANHPALAKAFLTFNGYIATASSISARLRELVILRISWLRHSEYEFVQHLVLGRRAGLSEIELDRIQVGPTAAGWALEDTIVLRAVDELHFDACITDDTWTELERLFKIPQILDFIFLVGCYHTLGLVLNSIRLPLEAGVTPLDTEVRARLHSSHGRSNGSDQ